MPYFVSVQTNRFVHGAIQSAIKPFQPQRLVKLLEVAPPLVKFLTNGALAFCFNVESCRSFASASRKGNKFTATAAESNPDVLSLGSASAKLPPAAGSGSALWAGAMMSQGYL